jgi:hypothetical protein
VVPFDHALVGGAQPITSWWAPVAALYIKRWGPAAQVATFTVRRKPHRHPYQSRVLAQDDGKLRHRHHCFSHAIAVAAMMTPSGSYS